MASLVALGCGRPDRHNTCKAPRSEPAQAAGLQNVATVTQRLPRAGTTIYVEEAPVWRRHEADAEADAAAASQSAAFRESLRFSTWSHGNKCAGLRSVVSPATVKNHSHSIGGLRIAACRTTHARRLPTHTLGHPWLCFALTAYEL